MEIDLQTIDPASFPAPQQAIFHIFQAALTSPTSIFDKIEDITDQLEELCPPTASDEELRTALWNIWLVLIDIVPLVPANHTWQDILVGALNSLRERPQEGKIRTIVRPSIPPLTIQGHQPR